MIPIAKPWLGEEEKKAVLQVLDSGMLAQGKKVAELEKAFAEFIGVKHAIATSNGTTALHAALLAHNISTGDEVITTPFSFIATANTISMCGAKPVFVDIEKESFNIDPELIEKAITPKTKAIMPVHLYGKAANMSKIMELAKKHNLIVIEDACQAHGAEFIKTNETTKTSEASKTETQKVGSFGTGSFSFYPTKNMTCGEGGIITTNEDIVAAKARKIIAHGSEKRYYHDHLGYNYRMTDIAAAIGLEQLKKLPRFNDARKNNARYFQEKLSSLTNIILPKIDEGHVFHQYTIRIKNRDKVLEHLTAKGIQTGVFYPVPIHQQKSFSEYNQQSFPVAEKIAKEALSIPVHPQLSEEDKEFIVRTLTEINHSLN
ncbi:DegT/DnrJ/EryC1/StrS family aminotransferase [Candidatus Woesearchaeota archaeon]|nr:DegT/DnrJ/EryC1/StrS family aminotransferase [Candidatus Woesearchaeota archaeon]